MRKLTIYPDGQMVLINNPETHFGYIVGGTPSDEIDITDATDAEIQTLMHNPKDKVKNKFPKVKTLPVVDKVHQKT